MSRYHIVDVGPSGIVDLDCICTNEACTREHAHVFTDDELRALLRPDATTAPHPVKGEGPSVSQGSDDGG